MKNPRSYEKRSFGWLFVLVVITSVSMLVYALAYLHDFAGDDSIDFWQLLYGSVSQGVLSNMPEVIAGVLGITVTVVAIVVELASNRYTSRITELFVTAPTNLVVLGFFVVTAILCIWVSLTGSSPGHVPHAGAAITTVAITICMVALMPYFGFVFNFLNPHNIIDRMASSTLAAMAKGGRGKGARSARYKERAVRGIEQLADVALNAIDNKDKVICMHAVNTLGRLMRDYFNFKGSFLADWFTMDFRIRENPDFVSMQEEVLDDIERGRYWLEMKILRQYQMLYGETLNRMRDINYLIAINTRKAAQEAMDRNDEPCADLAIRFFNTYMRATINSKDVRTAYNVLNQYRLLAENALVRGRNEAALDAARRFQYYGQLGFSTGLAFVLETAAYDLCTLNELAYKLDAGCRDELLEIFLDVDKEAEEGHDLEASLRGVRKAQIKLATYYLIHGADDLARSIYKDMRDELPSRLTSIREELDSITSESFWEVSDRGVNFDYLDPERRATLDTFFGWFS